jgi:hypothetical protein
VFSLGGLGVVVAVLLETGVAVLLETGVVVVLLGAGLLGTGVLETRVVVDEDDEEEDGVDDDEQEEEEDDVEDDEEEEDECDDDELFMTNSTEDTSTVTVKPVAVWIAVTSVVSRLPELTAVDMVVISEVESSILLVTAVPMSTPTARRVVSVMDVTDTLLTVVPNTLAMEAI